MDDPTREGNPVYPVESAPPRIKDLPPSMQPREMLERLGAAGLPDAVLLAILLRVGLPGKNVLELSEEMIARYGSLAELSRAPLEELREIRGVKRVKALTLLSAFEIGRRLRDAGMTDAPSVRTPEDVVRTVGGEASEAEVERFWMLPLNKKNRLITRRAVQVTSGLLDASLVHPREVFRPAIRVNSSSVVIAHNHPSGDPTPSAEDVAITRKLVEAGRMIDIRVLDHVILGRCAEGSTQPNYFSIREAGLVSFES